MAKNNVGSLYYEILLSPDGYKKGAAKIRKEDADLASYLKRSAKDTLSEKDKIRAEAERASKANWRQNAGDPKRRAEISKLIVEDAKRRIKAVEVLEEKARADKLLADKRAQQKKKESIIEGMKKLIAKQKVIDDKARDEKRKADKKAARNAPRTGMAGMFDKFQGIAGKIGTVTMAVWPLVQVFKALGSAVGVAASAFMGLMSIVDKFKMQSLKIAKFLKGDIKTAEKLTSQVEDYAIATSLSVEAGLDMAASLLVLGVNADHVAIRLKQFNSVAMGDAEMFKRVAKAYTDVLGAGVLKATELRQFTESGAPINEALEKLLRAEGRFTGNIQQMVSERLITSRDVGKALDIMGEKFKGLDTAALNTVAGQIENIQEEFVKILRHSDLAGEMNELVVDILKNFGKLASTAINAFSKMEVETGIFTEGLWAINEAMKAVQQSMLGLMRMRSLLATGNMYTYEQEFKMLEKIAKQNEDTAEKSARKDADKAEAKAARDKKAAEAQESYEKALAELQDKRNDAQKKYDEWRKANNLDNMSEMQQRNLNDAYYYSQAEAASKASEEGKAAEAKSDAERQAKIIENALNTALPQDAFKQNSVEEFRYLQAQRKQAERDRREEERYEQKREEDKANAKLIADSIENINFTNTAETAI